MHISLILSLSLSPHFCVFKQIFLFFNEKKSKSLTFCKQIRSEIRKYFFSRLTILIDYQPDRASVVGRSRKLFMCTFFNLISHFSFHSFMFFFVRTILSLPYSYLVGGVFAISQSHFNQVNGFSNLYWGWGGEDDDLSHR